MVRVVVVVVAVVVVTLAINSQYGCIKRPCDTLPEFLWCIEYQLIETPRSLLVVLSTCIHELAKSFRSSAWIYKRPRITAAENTRGVHMGHVSLLLPGAVTGYSRLPEGG
ncbi:hypothetical protein E2C01_048458 [Portunus trituberculatus]|uniref:Secreted protein n=1 Tax=Portunus trituberculatus TaxID=210409 RepID=A0A5B7GAY4_PORTR|nr:hypothetical protein [Portunus trituberculatus]